MLTIDKEIELQRMVRRTILRAPRPEDVRRLQPVDSREREAQAGPRNILLIAALFGSKDAHQKRA